MTWVTERLCPRRTFELSAGFFAFRSVRQGFQGGGATRPTLPYDPPETSHRASGLIQREGLSKEAPARSAAQSPARIAIGSTAGSAPDKFQTCVGGLDASHFPSGLTVRAPTLLPTPSPRGLAPGVADLRIHNNTPPSAPPVASQRPSGVKTNGSIAPFRTSESDACGLILNNRTFSFQLLFSVNLPTTAIHRSSGLIA